MARQFEEIKFYREWNLGRNTAPRKPQSSGLPAKYLEENARNLGMVINDMVSRLQMRPLLVDYLQRFYAPITDIATLVHGGTVQLFLHEEGLNVPIPATRLSDGTLRYLCLLAVLLHPEPPPLICIEEPELGLHPDILPTIAELLIDATQRTQLIVTTHSDQLVGCLSDIPEAVVVCERDEGGTKLSRLDPEKLAKWLEDYTLDQLWSMGEIGGNPQ
jgi:predicted ATPase